MRIATIDIGTNSVLLLVAQADPKHPAHIVALHEDATITRLGQGVDQHRRLHADAVERTLACLREYRRRILDHSVDRLEVVSTSAARDATGADEFLDAAQAILGTRPRVISGELEARLTFRGALTGLGLEGDVVVFDIGGGSTEVVVGGCEPGELPEIRSARSLDIGCVRLTERSFRADPPSPKEIEAARATAREFFSTVNVSSTHTWVGIGGTITTLMAMELGLTRYDAARVHGASLSASAAGALRRKLGALDLEHRKQVPGLAPKRADVIVAGALLVEEILARAGQERTLVSDRGVRWGLALELLEPKL